MTAISNFFVVAFATPPIPEVSYTFSDDVLAVFNAIPHWDLIKTIMGLAVLVIIALSTFKILQHI